MKNFIKQNKGLSAFIIVSLFFAVWGLIFGKGDELIYLVFGQYIFLSILNLICSAAMVKKGTLIGFLTPVINTALSVLIPFCVFGKTDIAFLLVSAIPAAAGLVIGLVAFGISKAIGKKKSAKTEVKEEKKEEAKA